MITAGLGEIGTGADELLISEMLGAEVAVKARADVPRRARTMPIEASCPRPARCVFRIAGFGILPSLQWLPRRGQDEDGRERLQGADGGAA